MNRFASDVDDEMAPLQSSFDRFRRSLDELEPPEFRPRRPIGPTLLIVTLVAAGGLWMALAGVGSGGVESIDSAATEPTIEATDPTVSTEPTDSAEPADSADSVATEEVDGASAEVVPLEDGAGLAIVPIGRVGDSDAEADPGSTAVVPLNTTATAWNADGSRLLLYRSGGMYLVVSPAEERIDAELALDPVDIEHVFWDPVDPTLVHTLTASGLATVDVTDGRIVAEPAIPDCIPVAPAAQAAYIGPAGQLGLRCQSEGGDRWVVVDLDGTVLVDRIADRPGSPIVSPTGNHVVVAGEDSGVLVYDAAMQQQIAEFIWPQDLVLTVDGSGRDVMVGPDYTDESAIGALVMVDLATGSKEVIIGPSTGDPYPMRGIEVAASSDGTVMLGAGQADGGEPGDQTLTAGTLHRIDLASGEVTEIKGSSGRLTGDDGPWNRWFPDLSADGQRLAFATTGSDGAIVTRVVP